jgi:hypothetical protein
MLKPPISLRQIPTAGRAIAVARHLVYKLIPRRAGRVKNFPGGRKRLAMHAHIATCVDDEAEFAMVMVIGIGFRPIAASLRLSQ